MPARLLLDDIHRTGSLSPIRLMAMPSSLGEMGIHGAVCHSAVDLSLRSRFEATARVAPQGLSIPASLGKVRSTAGSVTMPTARVLQGPNCPSRLGLRELCVLELAFRSCMPDRVDVDIV